MMLTDLIFNTDIVWNVHQNNRIIVTISETHLDKANITRTNENTHKGLTSTIIHAIMEQVRWWLLTKWKPGSRVNCRCSARWRSLAG
jgi:hypothetical protein